MGFPNTSGKIPGYDPGQVDALMARVERQYQNPELKTLRSDMLDVVKFDLVPGGYQIPIVDSALAKMAEIFLEREVAGRLRRLGPESLTQELGSNLKHIRKVAELGAGKAFTKERDGYRVRDVQGVVKSLELARGSIAGVDSMELRTISFRRSRTGLDRSEVDQFLSRIITALHLQRALR
jgi:DivIVA domain-containing protein